MTQNYLLPNYLEADPRAWLRLRVHIIERLILVKLQSWTRHKRIAAASRDVLPNTRAGVGGGDGGETVTRAPAAGLGPGEAAAVATSDRGLASCRGRGCSSHTPPAQQHTCHAPPQQHTASRAHSHNRVLNLSKIIYQSRKRIIALESILLPCCSRVPNTLIPSLGPQRRGKLLGKVM